MRGVSLRGRRLPANRSAGPARPPVVPAAVPRRSRCGHASAALPPPTGPCPEGRTHGPPPAGVLLPAIAPLMRAPPAGPGLPAGIRPGGTRYMTGTTTAARHPPAADDLHRQPMPQPFGMSAAPRGRWQARPNCSCPRLRISPPRARPRPEPAGHTICPPGSWTGHPAQARIAGPHGSMPRHRVKPCPPPISHRLPGLRPLPSRTRSGAGLAGQHLAGTATGRICVLTGNRAQPVAGVCRMFPIACYGLTPRCREVKR
jgi:hypothetical protein